MSVDPVHGSSALIEPLSSEKRPQSAPSSRVAEASDVLERNVVSGHSKKVEIERPKFSPAPLAIPEHEVEVVLDTPNNNALVYKVLDKQSGDVVLQVPSAEQLRGIHESHELLRHIAARGNVAAQAEEAAPATRG
jgi:hypothetical protein